MPRRLHIETRTPTAYGQAQTVLEFDFLGCSLGGIDCNNTVSGNDGLGARLRLAYGTLGPFAVGQMYGPGTDLAASPEALDLGCCAGTWAIGRLPQAVYTTEIRTPAGPATFQFALVDPEDSAATPQGQTLTNNTNLANVSLTGVTFTTPQSMTNAGLLSTLNGGSNQLISTNPLKTEWPDPVAGLNWQQPWGHLKLETMMHEAALVDGLHLNKQYIGYGGGVSGDVKPGWFGWAKDDIGFTAFAGNGLGRYAGGGGAGTYFPYLATNYGAPATPLGASVGNPLRLRPYRRVDQRRRRGRDPGRRRSPSTAPRSGTSTGGPRPFVRRPISASSTRTCQRRSSAASQTAGLPASTRSWSTSTST